MLLPVRKVPRDWSGRPDGDDAGEGGVVGAIEGERGVVDDIFGQSGEGSAVADLEVPTDGGSTGEGIVAGECEDSGAELGGGSVAGDGGGVDEGVAASKKEGGVVEDVAGDVAVGAAVADLEGAGGDGGDAGRSVVPARGQGA